MRNPTSSSSANTYRTNYCLYDVDRNRSSYVNKKQASLRSRIKIKNQDPAPSELFGSTVNDIGTRHKCDMHILK
jgi:hypothetical protein